MFPIIMTIISLSIFIYRIILYRNKNLGFIDRGKRLMLLQSICVLWDVSFLFYDVVILDWQRHVQVFIWIGFLLFDTVLYLIVKTALHDEKIKK